MVRKARYSGDRSESFEILRTHETVTESEEWDDLLPDESTADGDYKFRRDTEARNGTNENAARHLAGADWLDDDNLYGNCGDESTQRDAGGTA